MSRCGTSSKRPNQGPVALPAESFFDAVTGIGLDRRIISWNRAAERLYGYKAREAIGKPISIIVPRDRAGEIPMMLRYARRGRRLMAFETVRLDKRGQPIDVAMTISPIRDAKGRMVGASAVVRDIRERKRMEQALRESEERFRTIFASCSDGLFLLDQETQRPYLANPACLRMLGYSMEEFTALSIDDLHPREELPFIRDQIAKLFTAGKMPRADVQFICKDGSVLDTELNPATVRVGGKAFALVDIRDVGECRRMEAEIVRACEAERQRIGRELHDGLGQSLAAIAYLTSAVREDVSRDSLPAAGDVQKLATLMKLSSLIEQTVRQAHDLARGLCPIDVQQCGIVGALRELTARTQSFFDVSCQYAGMAVLRPLPEQVVGHVYRIAQEAVNNAVRHGHAKSIWIRLSRRKGDCVLTVQDSGVGITEDAHSCTGLGMRTMRYRADVIGGTLKVESIRGKGCRVTCVFPSGPGGKERA